MLNLVINLQLKLKKSENYVKLVNAIYWHIWAKRFFEAQFFIRSSWTQKNQVRGLWELPINVKNSEIGAERDLLFIFVVTGVVFEQVQRQDSG